MYAPRWGLWELLRAGRVRARLGRRGSAGLAEERGAALVEAVIIFPLVMLLTFGAIEFGIGFSQKGGIESVSRAGARTGATLAVDGTVDVAVGETANNSIGVETVRAVNAALKSTSLPEMNRVVVYRIEGATGTDYGPVTWGGACNSYCMAFTFDTGAKVFKLTQAAGGNWPIADRKACGTKPDRIGVLIEGKFNFLTNLVGNGNIKIKGRSVLQLEPTADC
jgi:Flp pilus assembly protein TadG